MATVAGTKKRRKSKKRVSGIEDIPVQLVLGAIAGNVASKKVFPMLLDKVEFLKTNPMLGTAIKVGGGLLLASMKNELVQGVGIGMAADGAGEMVAKMIPATTATAGVGSMNYIGAMPGLLPSMQLGTGPQMIGSVFGLGDNYEGLGTGNQNIGSIDIG
jgi:hypothetical protein